MPAGRFALKPAQMAGCRLPGSGICVLDGAAVVGPIAQGAQRNLRLGVVAARIVGGRVRAAADHVPAIVGIAVLDVGAMPVVPTVLPDTIVLARLADPPAT